MIVDNIENISQYKSLIPESVVKFIQDCGNTEWQNCKSVNLDDKNYANFDKYSPKPLDICRFEAHKKYIDIQIMIEGEEQIDITNIKGLEVSEEYDESRDVMFFKSPERFVDEIALSKGKFVMIYPYEAHRPQIKTTCDNVKKIVVKIYQG